LFVLFAEIINSALEALADSITLEHRVLIGRAKDLGSSGVFIALSFLLVVWGEALLSQFMLVIAEYLTQLKFYYAFIAAAAVSNAKSFIFWTQNHYDYPIHHTTC
jgi:hypothetical protein